MVEKIIKKFISVSGVHDKFIKDAIRENPYVPPSSITRSFQSFSLSDLKKSFYKEVNLYLDKSIYQYIISRQLLNNGHFSWADVTQYYANFFSISGLIRLHEHGFSMIGNNGIEIQNDSANKYKVRKISNNGLHRVVWDKFYSLFQNFNYKPHIFYFICTPLENNNNYYESDRRNTINYGPGEGYKEIYSTQSAIQRLKKENLKDSYCSNKFIRVNEWADIDNVSQNRIRLLANVIHEVDTLSDFPIEVKERLNIRKKFISKFEAKVKIRNRIIGWLEGK